jgi:hypothetical protein
MTDSLSAFLSSRRDEEEQQDLLPSVLAALQPLLE